MASPGRDKAWHERRVGSVRMLLIGLIVVLSILIGLGSVYFGSGRIERTSVLTFLIFVGVITVALQRLRKGRFDQAIVLVVVGALGVLARETVEAGVLGSSAFLFAYTVPICLAALLLGRLALLLTAGASVGIVAFVYVLERAGTPRGSDMVPSEAAGALVATFTLVVALLVVVLEFFGVERERAHRDSLSRAAELADVVLELQNQVEDRVRAEQERDRSEESLRFVSEAVGVGTWTWNLGNAQMNWSPGFREILGIPAHQTPSPSAFLAKIHPGDRPLFQELVDRPQEWRERGERTYRYLRNDGTTGWVTLRYRTLRAGEDQATTMVGILFEATDRTEAERDRERLLARERQARAAAESSTAKLSFLADASHILASTLDSVESLQRLSRLVVPRWADWCAVDVMSDEGDPLPVATAHREPALAEAVAELQRRFQASRPLPDAQMAIEEHTPQLRRVVTKTDLASAASGPEHLELLRNVGVTSMLVVPLMSSRGPLGSLTLAMSERGRTLDNEDVPFFAELGARIAVAIEQARLFAEIQGLNHDLERRVAERTRELTSALEELESFAYSVAHDLRNPLRALDGFAQTILEDFGNGLQPEIVARLGRIRSAAKRMGELIDALLELSRLSRSELHLRPVDLSRLATGIVDDLRMAHPHRRVDVDISEGLTVLGDQKLLRIALENILGNAWKFTGNNPEARIEVGSTMQDGEKVIYVRDNGAGFDMKYYGRLFVPFQRLHEATQFEGTGIGLATVHRVVARHGGKVWAVSETGKGTTLCFTLRT